MDVVHSPVEPSELDQNCLLCESTRFFVLPESAELGAVSSACEPWPGHIHIIVCAGCGHIQRRLDAEWHESARAIYAEYDAYKSSGGLEQLVFSDAGAAMARSAKIFERLERQVAMPAIGAMLDIGCANGIALRAFGERFTNWTLAGLEQTDRHRQAVTAIPGVEAFYAGGLDQVAEQFDLVTLIHVFEHMTEPLGLLEAVAGTLKPEGIALIQVPDAGRSPFVLTVMDHCSDFVEPTLRYAAVKSGLALQTLATDWVSKELTLVLRKARPEASSFRPEVRQQLATAASAVRWLRQVLDCARTLAENGPLGVFGTSIAGTWLMSMLAGADLFFVDEDVSRVGKCHMNRMVMAPDQLANGSRVVLAFPPDLAAMLHERLTRSYPGVSFILPPDMLPAA